MKLYRNEDPRLKRPFVITGALVGVAVSGWYIYRNLALAGMTGGTAVPDPVWTRFVNVALIMFSAIYVANLLRKYIEMFQRRKRG